MNHYSEIVEAGYDKIAAIYHRERDRFKNEEVLTNLRTLLQPGSHILNVGCGAGVPVARYLVDSGFNVTGIDISTAMVDLARKHVPKATFHKMDMRTLDFEKDMFDGIVAFYSLFHVSMAEQPVVLSAFHRTLRTNGVMLFTSGVSRWEDTGQMHGADMYWSHPEPKATMRMTEEAGFGVLSADTLECGGETHLWVFARKEST